MMHARKIRDENQPARGGWVGQNFAAPPGATVPAHPAGRVGQSQLAIG